MSDVLQDTIPSKADLFSASTSNRSTTLHTLDSPPVSLDNDKNGTFSEGAETENTNSTSKEMDLATFNTTIESGSYLENQVHMHNVYADLQAAKDQVLATRETIAGQEEPASTALETLAAQEAALSAKYDKTFKMLTIAGGHTLNKLERHPDEQAQAFNDLMIPSTMCLLGSSSTVLHNYSCNNNFSPVEEAGASVFENRGLLTKALSTLKSTKGCENESDARSAVACALHQLRLSLSRHSVACNNYYQQDLCGPMTMPDPPSDMRVVLTACRDLVFQAQEELQSTSGKGVKDGHSQEGPEQSTPGEREVATSEGGAGGRSGM